MKEFSSAVEDIIAEDEREEQIQAIIDASMKAREDAVAKFVAEGITRKSALAKAPKVKTREQAESEVDDEVPIEFLLDGRTMHAYPPTDGQLAFMLASLGRGQTSEGRFASIINVMLECLRDDDKDYFESRLLTRDPKKRLGVKMIEEIFEHLTTEWFARPTQ